MKLKVTNKEIYFAIESIWSNLHYKLKSQLNALVTANSEDDFEQEVEVDAESFIQIMKATSAQPQGVAKDINPVMHLKLKNQILAVAAPIMQELATLTDEQEIEDFKLANNQAMLDAKLLNGKTQILG